MPRRAGHHLTLKQRVACIDRDSYSCGQAMRGSKFAQAIEVERVRKLWAAPYGSQGTRVVKIAADAVVSGFFELSPEQHISEAVT